MNHKSAAKSHFCARMVERYGRRPTLKEMDDIRLAIRRGDCFWSQSNDRIIRAIVPFRNIAISVVYNRKMDGLVTAGCPLKGEIR
jgi:hypothetical protein